jgi:hypothetical protein
MKHVVLAIALLIGCSKKSNDLPAEAWGVADYTAAGLPAPDHTWTLAELAGASKLLVEIGASHPERLPRFDGKLSGVVFARFIEAASADPTMPIDQRVGVHANRYQAINAFSKAYVKNALAAPSREWIELMGALLREAVAIESVTDAFFASLGPDDPTRDTRVAGMAKMRLGWAGMLTGGFLVADNLTVPEPDRIALVHHMTQSLPILFPKVAPEHQQRIREIVRKMVEGHRPGPLRDALATAEQALPRSSR